MPYAQPAIYRHQNGNPLSFAVMQTRTFPNLKFQGQLRPSQQDVAQIARAKLESGQRKLHIVAPPGSGKTVLGLFLWAECVRTPALVLSPNSAVQAQWASRVSLFREDATSPFDDQPEDSNDRSLVSTSPLSPGLLTSLTYQSITLPARGCDDTDLAATALLVERLIDQEHADSPEAANEWINDLKQRNPNYFNTRLAGWRKQAREQQAFDGQALDMLNSSSMDALLRLKDAGVGLIILDECHHLMGHWGRILAAANEILDNPVIVGLTATPPDRDGQKADDILRYDDYFGPIDYEVPVPAVVRDGFLAPYQDLVWFTKPTEQELAFVSEVDRNFRKLLDALCQPKNAVKNNAVPALPDWLYQTLDRLELPAATCKTWKEFQRRDPDFAEAARVFLNASDRELPKNVPAVGGFFERLVLRRSQTLADLPSDVLKTVLDRYIRHGLRRSSAAEDAVLCEQAIDRLRLLGVQITETGSQACASPVTRILGYTHNKVKALVPILECELEQLDEHLRAVVITDYEKASAVSTDVAHVLNEEAGGAVAAFRELVDHPVTNTLDPILLTGSTILIDHDMAELFLSAAQHWLQQNSFNVQLELVDERTFHVVRGSGTDWCPRVYIQMVTQLFQDGITRCLVGTRGLLGEGWDANKINVLVDLTTVSTSMTVNQLRGRSIRLDPQQPEKLANNWDVVCIAPDFARGLDDYHRFCKKHRTIFGVTDDGAIEKGVGHVHAALSEANPDDLHRASDSINRDMLKRAANRDAARELWKIGIPYSGDSTTAIELKVEKKGIGKGLVPSSKAAAEFWTPLSLSTALAESVLETLFETEQLSGAQQLNWAERSGGYIRFYLKHATDAENKLFTSSLYELCSPFQRPRYIIPFSVNHITQKRLTGWMPKLFGKMFQEKESTLIRYHAIPSALSRNKDIVDIFQSHWNDKVSTGAAVYTQQGDGQETLNTVKNENRMPNSLPHIRDCFM